MVLGVEKTSMQADGTHDLLCSLLEVIRRRHIRRIRKQTVAASRSSRAASSNLTMGFFLRRASPSIHDVTFSRDRLCELPRRVPVLLEIAAADRDHLYAQPSQLAKIVPHGCEIELTLRRSIGKDRHQIPVAIRAVSSPGAAAEQPDLLGLEHFDDALDDSGWDGYGCHG